jgi:transketolase
MRDAFARAVVAQADRGDTVFLTGDLGYMALEPVREAFGDRFVNVGVAEQNMLGVAAGIARTGMRVYAYSIASFAALRAVEQVKLDIAHAGMDVCLVGNGGGYGYGHMGPTHHALDDLAVMSATGMRCLVPATDADAAAAVAAWSGPTYLRLGRREPSSVPVDSLGTASLDDACPARGLVPVMAGDAGHVVALGPLAAIAVSALAPLPASERPTVWASTVLPLLGLPTALRALTSGTPLLVVEEHNSTGGLGHQLSHALLVAGSAPRFGHVAAAGYPSGRYGSQAFHRQEAGLDADGIARVWRGLIEQPAT